MASKVKHFHKHLLSLVVLPLAVVRRPKICHTLNRTWMPVAEHLLSEFKPLNLQAVSPSTSPDQKGSQTLDSVLPTYLPLPPITLPTRLPFTYIQGTSRIDLRTLVLL